MRTSPQQGGLAGDDQENRAQNERSGGENASFKVPTAACVGWLVDFADVFANIFFYIVNLAGSAWLPG